MKYFLILIDYYNNLLSFIKKRIWSILIRGILKLKFYIIGFLTVIVLIILIFNNSFNIRAATFGWVQTTWSGGPSTTVANHNNNQTGWTFFSSKSSNLDTSANQLKISMIAGTTRTENTDADFSAGSPSNAYVANNSVIMLKPINATCSTKTECASDYCVGTPATCQVPPVECDGSTGTLTCGNICTYKGDIYHTVQIGSQCWLADNLRTTVYPDGSPITKGPSANGTAFGDNTTAYYSCPVTPAGAAVFGEDCAAAGGTDNLGMYYQWNAAMNGATAVATGPGPRGICPKNWHLPTDDSTTSSDVGLLINTVSGISGCNGNEATCLRSGGASGFNFPWAGYRNITNVGYYFKRSSDATFWSASNPASGYHYFEDISGSSVAAEYGSSYMAFSVRCVRN